MTARSGGRENDGGDGPANGLEAFALELRAQREVAGLTQEQLAKLMGYSGSVIAKLETCRTVPSPQHASQADEALKMPGTFRRLRKAMINGTYEAWVRAYLDIEDREDPPPPMLCVILGEAVLRQDVGEAPVMREQLGRLVATASNPRITIQVMPFSAGAHPGMLGPFVVASFDSNPDAAYLDNALAGQVTERRKEVAAVALLYETLAREALSPRASAEFIARVVEEWT